MIENKLVDALNQLESVADRAALLLSLLHEAEYRLDIKKCVPINTLVIMGVTLPITSPSEVDLIELNREFLTKLLN